MIIAPFFTSRCYNLFFFSLSKIRTLLIHFTKKNFKKVHCFVDDEGTVYKRFDDDEIGDIIGEWKDEQSIAKAREKMIAGLDSVRSLLEEISPELGVTDPVSGPVIMENK